MTDDPFERLDRIKEHWPHRRGFFSASFLAMLIYCPIGLILHSVLKNEVALLTTTSASRWYFFICFLVGMLILGGIYRLWKKQRSIPVLSSEKPSILFAVNGDKESKACVKRLYDGFKKELKQRGLENLIHHDVLSANLEIHNHEQANEALSKAGASLVVYGEYEQGNDKSKKVQHFKSLTYHYRAVQGISAREQALVAAMERFPFRIEETDSLTQIPRARIGFANLTLFFIGVSLTSMGNSIEARDLWRDLVRREEEQVKGGKRIGLYKTWWARNEFAYTRYIYRKHIENDLTNEDSHEYGKQVIESLELAKRELSSTPRYYMLRAICEFHTGDVRAAQRTTKDGWKKFPYARVSFDLSDGFLYLWRGMHKRALKSYRKTIRKSYPKEDAERVVNFFHTVMRQNPRREDLYFAVGFVRDNFSLSSKAFSDYDHFIDTCVSIDGIEPLINHAQQRLDHHYKQLEYRSISPISLINQDGAFPTHRLVNVEQL